MFELIRVSSNKNRIYGILMDDFFGKPICYTFELPWKNNQKNISCIPAGIYTCKPVTFVRPSTIFRIKDVENRTGIKFHTGNFAEDTKGCILVGLDCDSIEGRPCVTNSYGAFLRLKNYIPKEEFAMRIRYA